MMKTIMGRVTWQQPGVLKPSNAFLTVESNKEFTYKVFRCSTQSSYSPLLKTELISSLRAQIYSMCLHTSLKNKIYTYQISTFMLLFSSSSGFQKKSKFLTTCQKNRLIFLRMFARVGAMTLWRKSLDQLKTLSKNIHGNSFNKSTSRETLGSN